MSVCLHIRHLVLYSRQIKLKNNPEKIDLKHINGARQLKEEDQVSWMFPQEGLFKNIVQCDKRELPNPLQLKCCSITLKQSDAMYVTISPRASAVACHMLWNPRRKLEAQGFMFLLKF